MNIKLFIFLTALEGTVFCKSMGVFKAVRKAVENLSASICDRLWNPRKEHSMTKLHEDVEQLRNEMRHIRDEVHKNMPYLIDMCLDIYKNNSYTFCQFYEMDVWRFHHEFKWRIVDFFPIHAYLREANEAWYEIQEALEKLGHIKLMPTSTLYWQYNPEYTTRSD